MKKIKIFLMIISSTVIASCESNTYNDLYDMSVKTDSPTYLANIKPIMTSNCTSCHSNGNQFPNLETYVEVKEACVNGSLLCRIDGNTCGSVMPLGGKMQQIQIDLIKLWASKGFIQQ